MTLAKNSKKIMKLNSPAFPMLFLAYLVYCSLFLALRCYEELAKQLNKFNQVNSVSADKQLELESKLSDPALNSLLEVANFKL